MGSDWTPPRYADVTDKAKETVSIPNPNLPVEDQVRVAGVKSSEFLFGAGAFLFLGGTFVDLFVTIGVLTGSSPYLLLLWLAPIIGFFIVSADSESFRASRLKLSNPAYIEASYDCAQASADWIKVRTSLYGLDPSGETLEALALLEPQVAEALSEWAVLSHEDKRTVELANWMEEVVVKAEALLASETRRYELTLALEARVRDSSSLDRALEASQIYTGEVKRVLEA